jgi:hypothetical protein
VHVRDWWDLSVAALRERKRFGPTPLRNLVTSNDFQLDLKRLDPAFGSDPESANNNIKRSIGRGLAATKDGLSIFPDSLPEATKDDSNYRRGGVR